MQIYSFMSVTDGLKATYDHVWLPMLESSLVWTLKMWLLKNLAKVKLNSNDLIQDVNS